MGGQDIIANLITGGRPRAVPLVRWHAARVATKYAAAFRVEIWKHRRARLLIDDELTGVGIARRAAPLAASSPCSFFLLTALASTLSDAFKCISAAPVLPF